MDPESHVSPSSTLFDFMTYSIGAFDFASTENSLAHFLTLDYSTYYFCGVSETTGARKGFITRQPIVLENDFSMDFPIASSLTNSYTLSPGSSYDASYM